MEENTNVTAFDKLNDKVKSIRKTLTDAAWKVVNFCIENPIAAALIAGTASSAITQATKAYKDHNEMVRRRRDFFDPRTGRHCFAKRDLDPNEQAYVDARHDNGETYVKILSDMGLLK